MKSRLLTPKQLASSDAKTVYVAYEEHMLLKNYSTATVKTYLCNLRKYLHWCHKNRIEHICEQETERAYLLYRVKHGAK